MNCKNCANEIEIKNKWDKQKVFCSRSCAAIFNNKKKGKLNADHRAKISASLKKFYKKNPNKILSGHEHSVIVGKAVRGRYNKKITSIYDVSTRTIQKILKRVGVGCCICGWNESTCDIHHINGRKIENCNNHSNLTILCPNCHRKTHDGLINKDKLIPLTQILPSNWQDFYYG